MLDVSGGLFVVQRALDHRLRQFAGISRLFLVDVDVFNDRTFEHDAADHAAVFDKSQRERPVQEIVGERDDGSAERRNHENAERTFRQISVDD